MDPPKIDLPKIDLPKIDLPEMDPPMTGRRIAAAVFAVAFAAVTTPAVAAGCERIDYGGAPFTACTVDLEREDLRLFLNDPTGRPWGQFTAVDRSLRAGGKALGLAMNGGMYHADRSPVGLYVEDGVARHGIVTAAGPGNFGLLPNGVLCIGAGRAAVIESRRFDAGPQDCRYATQSGPMLVTGGALHPRFIPGSLSRHIRNGVGVQPDGRTVMLAISEAPVSFDLFARFFRDRLGTPDALYLDGSISRLWAPAIGRRDVGRAMGPILGTVVKAR
jgi:uncharacterized protein YigE (DUF2233 family)